MRPGKLQAAAVTVRWGGRGNGGEVQPVSVKARDISECGGTSVVLGDKDILGECGD